MLLMLAVLTLQGQNLATGIHLKFDFGSGKASKGFTKVTGETLFTENMGYGFLSIQDLKDTLRTKGTDLTSDFISSSNPFYFAVKIPDGNYNIKVTVGDPEGTSSQIIRAENRRLMVENTVTSHGNVKELKFTIHMGNKLIDSSGNKMLITEREVKLMHFDDLLTLEFAGSEPKIAGIEIEKNDKAVTVFLAGNSTVCDWESEPGASWGQMFPGFFKPNFLAVANYAESGETLLAFKRELRLEKIWRMAKPGDYLFIEFAHNDQKNGINHLDAFTTYQQTLVEWVNEARKRKLNPVLVTSMARRSFTADGKANNTLGDYPEAVRRVSNELNAPLIDLNKMSMALYDAWGVEGSAKGFIDGTHTNVYGAFELARCIAQDITVALPVLTKFLKPQFKKFNSSQPDPVDIIIWPPGLKVYNFKPIRN